MCSLLETKQNKLLSSSAAPSLRGPPPPACSRLPDLSREWFRCEVTVTQHDPGFCPHRSTALVLHRTALPPGGLWQHLQTFVAVMTGEAAASISLNVPPCTRLSLTTQDKLGCGTTVTNQGSAPAKVTEDSLPKLVVL